MSNYKDMTDERLVTLYEMYHAGKMDINEYRMVFIDLLEGYIRKLVAEKPESSVEWREDYMQNAYMAIIELIDQYDPRLGRPTTFFTNRLVPRRHTREGMTEHLRNMYVKANKAVRECGYTDLDDPRLTPQAISVISEIPLTTIKGVMEARKRKFSSIDEDNAAEIPAAFGNPENMYVEKENLSALYSGLKNCTPLEKYMVSVLEKYGTNIPYNTVVADLRKPEQRARFRNEITPGVEINAVKRMIKRAITKLASTEEFQNAYGTRMRVCKPESEVSFEQATDDDLFDLFA